MKKALYIFAGSITLLYLVGTVVTQNLHTEIDIDASPEVVWNHLIDVEQYPAWNPFIKNVTGTINEGAQIATTIQSPGQDPMDFTPTLLVVEPAKELRWLGRLGIPGLFDGEHYFILESISENETKFIHGENFSGLVMNHPVGLQFCELSWM